MNDTTHKLAFFGTLVVAAVVLPMLLGAGLQWPTWARVALAVAALASVAAIGVRHALREPQPPPPPALPTPAPRAPAPPSRAALDAIRVPTALPDYRFQVSATVLWQANPGPGDRHESLESVAKCAVADRAVSIARQMAPQDHLLAGLRLSAALGVPQTTDDGRVTAWATDVVVAVPPDDADRLATLERLRKDAEVWQRRRDHEVDVRRYLCQDVLTSPGSAVAWWLARNIDEIDGAVARIESLTRLSALIQGREAPVQLREPATELPSSERVPTGAGRDDQPRPSDVASAHNLLEALFPDSDSRRAVAVQELARLAERWHRADLADAIKRIDDTLFDEVPGIYVQGNGSRMSEADPLPDSELAGDGERGPAGSIDPEEPDGPAPTPHPSR
jgi:hypothetical protein